MKVWLRKLRGLLGLSATGAGVGAVVGAGWVLISGLLGYSGLNPATFVWGAGVLGMFGGMATAGVGLSLAMLRSGRTLRELSVGKAGVWGAIGGAAASMLFLLVATIVTGLGVNGLTTFLGVGAGLGAILGSGVIALAKSAALPDALRPKAVSNHSGPSSRRVHDAR